MTKIILSLIWFLVWSNGVVVKNPPEINPASNSSGYSEKIHSLDEIQRFFNLDDGGYLLVRYVNQYREATGINAFPDGGIPFYLLTKHDLIRVSKEGKIIWQNQFIEKSAPNYDYSSFTIKNAVTQKNNFPEILTLDDINTIRQCSPSVIQLARRNEQKIPGKSGYNEEDYTFTDSFNKQGGIQIDLDSGTIKNLKNTNELCEKDIRNQATTVHSCDVKFSKMDGMAWRKVIGPDAFKNFGIDWTLYTNFLNTCIKPLLKDISPPPT